MGQKSLTDEQLLQENQYERPYHYFIERDSWAGAFYFSYLDECARQLAGFSGKKILDLGCGDGFFLSTLDDMRNELTGLDYSVRALSFARSFTTDRHITFIEGALNTLPFPDRSFDVLTSIAVLEHVPPAELTTDLREMHRVLKDDGVLIIALPTHNLPKPKKHFQHFSPEEFERIAKPLFSVDVVRGRYRASFRFLERLFDNRWYCIKPLVHFVRTTIFARFFAAAPIAQAEMLVTRLVKKTSTEQSHPTV